MEKTINEEIKIKNDTIAGLKWVTLLQLVVNLLSFLINLVLARILMPSDYGLVGLITVITSIIITVVDMGLNAAIIQRKSIDNNHLSTAFFANFFVAIIMCLLLCVFSPAVGLFFNKAELPPMLRFFSLIIIVKAFVSVQMAVYERNLLFKSVAVYSIFAHIFSSGAKLLLALYGFGAWSLIIGHLMYEVLLASLLWCKTIWKPNIKHVNRKSFNEVFSFGNKILLINLIDSTSSKLDVLFIGKLVSTTSLGIYSMGYMLSTVLPSQINSVIQRVMFPAFSRMQDNKNLIIKSYLELTKYISLMGLPVVIGVLLISSELVYGVLTEKWETAIPIINVLCIYSISNVIGGALWGQVLKALGKPKDILILTIIRIIAMTLFILTGSRWGLIGIVWSLTIYGWAFRFIFQHFINKVLGIGMMEYIKSLSPAFLSSAVMIVSVLLLKVFLAYLNAPVLFLLFVIVISGAVMYIVAFRFIDKNSYIFLKKVLLSFALKQ